MTALWLSSTGSENYSFFLETENSMCGLESTALLPLVLCSLSPLKLCQCCGITCGHKHIARILSKLLGDLTFPHPPQPAALAGDTEHSVQ